jgi:hypothetical protein
MQRAAAAHDAGGENVYGRIGADLRPCDLNCDGGVDNFDITPFVLALTASAPSCPEYHSVFLACDRDLGDINGDGRVDNFDITPFAGLLAGR